MTLTIDSHGGAENAGQEKAGYDGQQHTTNAI